MISFILIALTSSKVFLSSTDERNFLSWMRENGEFFTGSEYHFRLGVFLSNSRFVTEFNRNTKNSFRLSLNHLACWTHAEYRAILGHSKSSKFERSKVDLHNIKYNTNHLTVDKINQRNLLNNSKYHKYAKFSKSVDWREKGGVNPIQDQKSCGSCWSFAACAAFEGAWFASSGKLVKISEQLFVDCCKYCFGCYGGSADAAYNWAIHENDGKVCLHEDYPYTGTQGVCRYKSSMAYGHVSQYVRVFSLSEISDEDLMCQTLEEIGPLTVAIDADGAKFRLYDSGIYYDDTCVQGDANHAVAVVGYGEEDNGEQYFIVRNSWGLSWGEAGYIRMLRNVNLCGIADEVYYPVI